ncbi:MAG TPA: O-antigen ligase family protein [Candidatus Sulfotelmatobacter sp.]|nr:O-antigen ligase family protein [Candidatus Sulfotelmatobacter sp.]
MPSLQTLRPRLLMALAFAAPPTVLLSPLAMSPLMAVAGLLCLPGLEWRRLVRLPVLPLMAAALIWAGMSLNWTPNPAFAVVSLLRTAGVIIAGIPVFMAFSSLASEHRGKVLDMLRNGLLISSLPILVLGATAKIMATADLPVPDWLVQTVVHFDRPATTQALLLLPCLSHLWRTDRRRQAAVLALLVGVGVMMGVSLAAKIALLTGLLILAAGFILPRRLIIAGCAMIMMVTFIGGPAAVTYFPRAEQAVSWSWMPLSSVHRLLIWHFVDDRIDEKPLQGWGYESAREIGQKKTAIVSDGSRSRTFEGEYLPLHPHNFSLQIRLELGLAGTVLFAGLMLILLRGFWQNRQVVETAVMAGAFFVCLVAYGFWQSWWLCALWMVAGLCRLLPVPEERRG